MLPTNADATRITAMPLASGTDRADRSRKTLRALVATSGLYAGMARAATGDAPEWIQWAVLGAIALLVIGVGLRMILAARFPKGYGAWARSRRDEFADRNAKWDAGDEDPRR
jgi:hypothetical protein